MRQIFGGELSLLDVGRQMIQGLIAGIAGRIQSVIDSFKRIIASIVGVFTGDVTIAEAASAVVGAMVDVWKAVTPDLALFRWVQDSVEGAIQGVIDWIAGRDVEGAGSGLVGRFLRGIIDRVGDVVAAFTGLWDLIKGTFVTGEADLGDLARGVWDAIVAVFRASPAGLLFGWIAPKLSEAWEALKERAAAIDVEGEGAGLVARFVAGFVGRIEDVIAAAAGLWDAIVGAFVTGEADMTEVANGIWNAVVAVFRLTPAGLFFEWIAPKLTAAWDAAKAAIEERGGLAESIVKGFEEDVVLNAVGSLWDKAKARVEERGGLFASIGQGFEDDAILNGIGDAWDAAVAAIQDRGGLAQAILQGLRDDPILQELIAEFAAIGEAIGTAWDNAVEAIRERGGLWQAILTGLQEDPILQALLQAFADIGASIWQAVIRGLKADVLLNPILSFFVGGEGEDGEDRPGLVGRIFGDGGDDADKDQGRTRKRSYSGVKSDDLRSTEAKLQAAEAKLQTVPNPLPVGPVPPAAGAQGTGGGTTITIGSISVPITLSGDATPEQAAEAGRIAGTAAADAIKEQLRSAAEQSDTNQRA